MPYVRAYTDEELAAKRREFGKMGAERRRAVGYENVGRKKGGKNKKPNPLGPIKNLTVREPDYKIFYRLAAAKDMAVSRLMHLVAETLKARNPQLFKPSLKAEI